MEDIEETLRQLRQTSMKLNRQKCVFGAQKGKFLGHIITTMRIEENIEKSETLLKVKTPMTIKYTQSLNGKLAVVGRFLANSADQTLPFFQELKTHISKTTSNCRVRPRSLPKVKATPLVSTNASNPSRK